MEFYIFSALKMCVGLIVCIPYKVLMFFKIIKILAVCSIVMNFLLSSDAYARSVPEYYVKGLFLLKILDFVQWPDESLEKNTVKMICVYGEDPFSDYQAEIGATVEQHVIFQYIDDINHIDGCHILFISQSERFALKTILSSLIDKPVLTVSDIDKFAYKNGMIELSIHKRKKHIQFSINLDAVKNSGLNLSSNLIELAANTYGNSHKVISE